MPNGRTNATDTANSAVWRTLAWIGVALQAAALIWALWSQTWNGAWTIGLFLAMSVLFLLMQDRLPTLLDFIVVVAAVVNAGGWAWEWYQSLAWFDEFVHAFTSFALVSAVAYLGVSRNWIGATPGTTTFVLWAAGIGLGLGIVWEILESLFLNLTFWDTIVDLVMDTLGAAAAGWFLGWLERHLRTRRP